MTGAGTASRRRVQTSLVLPVDLANWLAGAFPPAVGGGTLGGTVARLVPALLEAMRTDLETGGTASTVELVESYRRLSPAGRASAVSEAVAALTTGGGV